MDPRLTGLVLLLAGCRSPEGAEKPDAPGIGAPDTGFEAQWWPPDAAQVTIRDSTEDSRDSGGGDSGGDTAEVEWPGLSLDYRRVSVAGYVSCALTATGKIVCWGDNSTQLLNTPSGIYLEVSVLGGNACALREDGEIICWGVSLNPNFPYPPPPPGRWARLRCSSTECVALDLEGYMTWWAMDNNYYPITYDPPKEQFIDIESVFPGVCTITSDRSIKCWDIYSDSASDHSIHVFGNFKKLSGSPKAGCGLDGDGQMTCWDPYGNISYPRYATWKDLSITGDWNCGVMQNNIPACWGCVWGRLEYCNFLYPPDIPMVQVSSDMEHGCGITPDNRFVCWGWDWAGETIPPEAYQ